MSIRDRTGEFRAAVEFGRQQPVVTRRRSPNPAAVAGSHSTFMQKASSISKDIQTTLHQLERLTLLTKSRSTAFDDGRAVEAIEVASMVEQSLARLNTAIGELRSLQRTEPEQRHSSNVVVSLQTRLADATKHLQIVLREREQREAEQRARREQFSAGTAVPAKLALNVKEMPRGTDREPLLDTVIDMTATAPAGGYQQMALLHSHDTAYLHSRNAAVKSIEASISEIGQIFMQLSHMIAEQGEQVQRIDANIDDVGVNIGRGHSELLKYFKHVDNNRWLLLKMFAVLIVFVIFFNAFIL